MIDAELVAILRTLNLNPRRSGSGWASRCPVHDDRMPSLSSRIAQDGRVLLYCHAGCPFPMIASALGVCGVMNPSGQFIRKVEDEPKFDPLLAQKWSEIRTASNTVIVEDHERTLGIPRGGLRRLGVAWAAGLAGVAAPMMDSPGGNLIGVRLRADDGRKWAITGSHNGLFIPTEFVGGGPLYMPEGLTDTAAISGLGLDAVGRPSCNGGRTMARAVAKIAARPVIVVSDADAPGIEGANLLARELTKDGMKAKVIVPPCGYKDARAWIADGATKADIEFVAQYAGLVPALREVLK